ncbi:MAG: hypothetical protein V2J65_21295 [Desulfobacteraceae bacterium]|nr:hypothetical protein [Desulfobacteraceae bacterium]
MSTEPRLSDQMHWPTLTGLPTPVKVLLSCILLTLALAMAGALGQIIVHDIIPTFFGAEDMHHGSTEVGKNQSQDQTESNEARGDLFGEDATMLDEPVPESILANEQFVWILRWTHIHLFGMTMIFIFLGAVTIFLDISVKTRSWLVALPFVGVVVDIAAMWLKGFVSPVFFWLHIPGGGLFAGIFFYVFWCGMFEMWFRVPATVEPLENKLPESKGV